MRATRVSIRCIGNSKGVVLPKPARTVREGWAAAAQKVSQEEADTLVMGEFANDDDAEMATGTSTQTVVLPAGIEPATPAPSTQRSTY